jgi:signal transduction histidine kinase/CheY-like chemotaxis protein
VRRDAVPLRVLVVDDDDTFVELLQLWLTGSVVIAAHVERLADALAWLGEQAPDAILLDLALPDSVGLTTLHAVRAAAKDVPVVVLTGSPHEDVGLACVRAGADDFLNKSDCSTPILKHTLMHAVERGRMQRDIRAIVWKNADAMFVLDPGGSVLFANPAAEQLFGRAAVELVGVPLGIPVTEDGASLDVRRPDGAVVPTEVRVTGTTWQGAPAFLVSIRDMTERDRAQNAEAASHAKGRFLATVSHDIRTPMNAILGYAQLLSRDPTLTTEQRRYVEIIDKSGAHLLEMINDVLDIAKIEAGHQQLSPDTVDLPVLLGDIARMFTLRAEAKQISFAFHVSPGLPRHVVTDEGKLRRVLINLLSNAMKFTREGSVTARFSVRPAAKGPRLRAEVEDTGPGIAPEELAALFQPFAQASAGVQAGGGTGLGLAISRDLARLMGGDVEVESTLGQGSTFRLEIPCAQSSAPSGAAAGPWPARCAVLEGSSARILVVDDAEDNAAWLEDLLRQVGFEVRSAADGAAALIAVDDWDPHLVLMDMFMPVMDGYAATRAIRGRRAGRRPFVVAVTANAFEEARAAIFDAGADGWVRKPFREADVLEEIARHLGVRYVHADAPPVMVAPAASRVEARPLPADLAGELCDAAFLADYERLGEIILAIPPELAGVAAEIRRLADGFEYERIARYVSCPAAG